MFTNVETLVVPIIGARIVLWKREMKLSKEFGMILLSAWLIATGLISLLDVRFPGADMILAILAVAAGAVIGLGLRGKKLSGNLGLILLALWLILAGIASLFGLNFTGIDMLMALLAVIAGGLILFKR